MLTDRLGVPASVQALLAGFTERWDGKGDPGRARGDEIPLAVRIAHVARDADLQRMLGGVDFAAGVIRDRAGAAFDPRVAGLLVDGAAEILAFEPQA
jgi:response regulator RpfG family c-di-GMP phosphodiesterase